MEDILNTEIDKERATKLCRNEGCANIVAKPYWDKKDHYWRYHHVCGSCFATKLKFKITSPERNKILEAQYGLCKICKSEIAFMGNKSGAVSQHHAVIDHDHNTGAIRGIICGRCNIILGKANDNPKLLSSLIKYLRK